MPRITHGESTTSRRAHALLRLPLPRSYMSPNVWLCGCADGSWDSLDNGREEATSDCYGYRVWLLLAAWNGHGLTCSASSMSPVQGIASCPWEDTANRTGVQSHGEMHTSIEGRRLARNSLYCVERVTGQHWAIISSFFFSIVFFPLNYACPFSVLPFCLCLFFPDLPYLFLLYLSSRTQLLSRLSAYLGCQNPDCGDVVYLPRGCQDPP